MNEAADATISAPTAPRRIIWTPEPPPWYEPVTRPSPSAAAPSSNAARQQTSATCAVTFSRVCTFPSHGTPLQDGSTLIGSGPGDGVAGAAHAGDDPASTHPPAIAAATGRRQ